MNKPFVPLKKFTVGLRMAIHWAMNGLGIVDQSHWREWYNENQYNRECVDKQAKQIDNAIAAAVRKSHKKKP